MPKYRTYKNGLYAHRYNQWYIIKGDEKGQFSIADPDGTLFQEHLYDYDDCEWEIDKLTADEQDLKFIQVLSEQELYQLDEVVVELLQRKNRGELTPMDNILNKWATKIRWRKAEGRPL